MSGVKPSCLTRVAALATASAADHCLFGVSRIAVGGAARGAERAILHFAHARNGVFVRLGEEQDFVACLRRQVPDDVEVLSGKVLVGEKELQSITRRAADGYRNLRFGAALAAGMAGGCLAAASFSTGCLPPLGSLVTVGLPSG